MQKPGRPRTGQSQRKSIPSFTRGSTWCLSPKEPVCVFSTKERATEGYVREIISEFLHCESKYRHVTLENKNATPPYPRLVQLVQNSSISSRILEQVMCTEVLRSTVPLVSGVPLFFRISDVDALMCPYCNKQNSWQQDFLCSI